MIIVTLSRTIGGIVSQRVFKQLKLLLHLLENKKW